MAMKTMKQGGNKPACTPYTAEIADSPKELSNLAQFDVSEAGVQCSFLKISNGTAPVHAQNDAGLPLAKENVPYKMNFNKALLQILYIPATCI